MKNDFWRKFGRRGSPTLPCQANHILLDRSNTFEHELTKCLISTMVCKGIPAHIYHDIEDLWVGFLQNAKGRLYDNIVDEKGRFFYTEAEKKDSVSKDVIDVVDLGDEKEIEIVYQNKKTEVLEKYQKEGRMTIILNL